MKWLLGRSEDDVAAVRSFGRAVSRLRDRMLFAEFYAWQIDRSFASEMRVIAAHIFAAVWVRTSLIMFGFTSFQPQGMRALESPRGML